MIPAEVLRKLPIGSFVRFSTGRDMDGNMREVIVWRFYANCWTRTAKFDRHTGEYIGDLL